MNQPSLFTVIVGFFLIAMSGIGWAVALQLSKENEDLERRLGISPAKKRGNSRTGSWPKKLDNTVVVKSINRFFAWLSKLLLRAKDIRQVQYLAAWTREKF